MELNREVLDCMLKLRRRLRAELALDIHLNQQDAVATMLDASRQSTDAQTRELAERLAQLSDTPPIETAIVAPSGRSERIYRGQRVYA